ncbi:MAG: glycosyl hydrolase [Lachnospiraceae bacterium]
MNQGIPAPLFRDPIYDGASDPVVIWNREEECFFMLYTQRRSTGVQVGVSSIHGSKIGVASSKDGMKWLYRGTLPNLDIEPGHNTFWAPEIIYAEGEYHMYVSYITGIPTDWNYERRILHYTAQNLWEWKFQGEIMLSSKRVIDACVYEIEPHVYKMWYKDESNDSHTYAAISKDLYHWAVLGPEVTDCSHEGANVFEFGGVKWLVTDFWNGLGVYKSDDFIHWDRCSNNLLDTPGKREMDGTIGHHADIVVMGEEAYIFYFCHPYKTENMDDHAKEREALTVLQAARLTTDGKNLFCNRDEEFLFQFKHAYIR